MPKSKRIGLDMRMAGEGFGLGRYIVELAKALVKSKSEFEYVFFFDKNFNESTFRSFQKLHSECRLVNAKYYTLQEQLMLPRILKKEKLDLIHFPNFNVPVLYRGKSVVTIHDLIHHRFPGKKKRNIFHRLSYRYIINKAVQNTNKVIAVSQSTKSDIINLLKINPGKIKVIHEGVSENFQREVSENLLNSTLSKYKINKPYILAVSEWRRYKNLDFLIRAFSGSEAEVSESYNLVICGKIDPNYPEQGEVLAREDKASVISVGQVPEDELMALYSGAKCFVSPSLAEGFGLTYLEAQSKNIPILASNIPVAREILGDSAYFFDPTDKNDLKEKMSKILNDKSFSDDLIEKGKVNLKRFAWEKVAGKTEEIYREVLTLGVTGLSRIRGKTEDLAEGVAKLRRGQTTGFDKEGGQMLAGGRALPDRSKQSRKS